jgi:exodeoxyribonuclease V alpha subunit
VDPGPTHEIEGQVDRITFANEETGYTVLKILTDKGDDPITAVGHVMSPVPGEILQMRGDWIQHPKFGRQFRIKSHRRKLPASTRGIKKYLESGLIRGIGPVMASRIVEAFGRETLDVIENKAEKLTKIPGIGEKRIAMIQEAWRDQKDIRDVMIFLQQYGVGTGYATKIFKTFGQNAIEVVTRNPYRLSTDIHGIGFRTADKIAQHIGYDKNAPARAEAGILHVLTQFSDEGHTCSPYELLIEKCTALLEIPREIVVAAFGSIAQEKRVIIEDLNRNLEGFKANDKAVYLIPLHRAEKGVAYHFDRLGSKDKKDFRSAGPKILSWVQKRMGVRLAPKQIEAVEKAISEKVMIITGGPGTGKTTIIHAILKIYRSAKLTVLLAAPTGRAAKRMREATGHSAKTIHRMLEFSFQKGGFQRNERRPLETDVLILDEASMIDTVLMYHLVKAVPSKATLILVGDVNQLPSVGAGNVLNDIINSETLPVVRLTDIFRQARQSRIITNAHRINHGLFPEVSPSTSGLEDFYFIEQEDPDQVVKIIIELVSSRIPNRFKMDPLEDIQVLSPMHKGTVGTENLNIQLREVLNRSGQEITWAGRILRLGDKVMQIKNNYEKEVFNGDIGRITTINRERQELAITFDGIAVPYGYTELDEVMPAYAISVHKAQGNEYSAVVLPLLSQHYLLLQRNLIYTAVTRGKRLVVIVGSKKALAMGIRNAKVMKRYTFLAERLVEFAKRTPL